MISGEIVESLGGDLFFQFFNVSLFFGINVG